MSFLGPFLRVLKWPRVDMCVSSFIAQPFSPLARSTQAYLETNEVADRDEAGRIADAVAQLLNENNFKVCVAALNVAALGVMGAPEHFRHHVPLFLPGVFDRLGDLKGPVREAGRKLLVVLMAYQVSNPDALIGKGSPGWKHKNWRVREELLRTVTTAFAELELERGDVTISVKGTLPQVVAGLEDREASVREAAVAAVVAMAPAAGNDIHAMLARHTIRPGQLREIQARLGEGDLGPGVPQVSHHGAGAGGGHTGPRHSGTAGAGSVRSGGQSSSSPPGASWQSAGDLYPGGRGSDGKEAGQAASPSVSGGGVSGHASSRAGRLGIGAGGINQGGRLSRAGGSSGNLNAAGREAERNEGTPPPYGAATGVIARIAEGAPPRPEHVDSERELVQAFDAVATKLGGNIAHGEWTDRLNALVRVEALILGGAVEWDSFPALLAKLRGPLTNQVADRRSSIVRQAAHLLVVLAAELGGEFEKDALHFVPELFKCVVITVQVIAESGDLGIRGILHNCQARHLIPKLCDAATKDRSAKLRCHATNWIGLVVREWDPLGEKDRRLLEEALHAMVSDGHADVRSGARRIFHDFNARWPEAAARLHARLDVNTQRLIASEATSYDHDEYGVGGGLLGGGERPERRHRRPSSARVKVPATSSAPGRSSAPSSPVDRHGYGGAEAYGAHAPPPHGTRGVRLQRAESMPASSNGGVAGRQGYGGSSVGRAVGEAGILRGGVGADGASPRGATQGARSAGSSSRSSARGGREAGWAAGGGGQLIGASPSIGAVLAAASSLGGSTAGGYGDYGGHRGGPSTWEDKVEVFDALARVLRTGGAVAARDAVANVAQLAETFEAHLGDAHHRVAQAALEAAIELVPAVGSALEPYLDRLCPAMFPRLVDAKESIRGLASAALAVVGDVHAADALLPALLRSLDVAKAPRAKTGVLEFALYVLSGQGGGTDPGGAGKAPATAGSHALHTWVARVIPLTVDRHAPLRAAASAGLAAVHVRADAVVVPHHLVSMPSAEAAAVCRALAPHAPGLEAEVNAHAALARSGGRSTGGGRFGSGSSARQGQGQGAGRTSSGGDRAAEGRGASTGALGATRATAAATGEGAGRGRYAEYAEDEDEDEDDRLAPPPARLEATRSASEADRDAVSLEATLRSSPTAGETLGEELVGGSGGTSDADLDADLDANGAASIALDAALSSATHTHRAAEKRAQALAAVRGSLRAGASLAADHAGQILALCLEALSGGTDTETAEARVNALATLRDLAQCAPRAFSPHAAMALPRILDAMRGDSAAASDMEAEVAAAAGDALDGIVEALPADVALRALAPHVSEGGAAPVRALGGVVGRMAPDTLMRDTPDLIPGLVRAFNSSSADVRKAVVDALVAMYDSLGDWLLPQLSVLSPAQQKLVTIYINRAMAKPGGGVAGGSHGGGKAHKADAAPRVPLAPRHV